MSLSLAPGGDQTDPSQAPATSRVPAILRLAGARLASNLVDASTVLPLILIGALIARAIWLDLPQNALIFDEAYYVNAARILLGLPVAVGAHYAGSPAGIDPNMEHPPLGKLIIAGSMLIFGDNGFGWRIPSLMAGMASLGTLYLIVRSAGESAWLGVLAVAFVALDNLSLVHSRIGTLDMLVLAPILLGAWLALRERWALAGVALGIGFLIKLTALYGLLAVLILLGLTILGVWRERRRISLAELRPVVSLVLAFSVVAAGGLALLDARFTTFSSPIDHVRHMVQYGTALKSPIEHAGICTAADSAPWQWPFNECKITYLRVDVTVRTGDQIVAQYPKVDFVGALNPLLASSIPIAILFTFLAAWRTRSRLAIWSIVWAAANYLPYVLLAILSQRITYIYYFLPVVPAVAVAVAILLLRSGLPRLALWGFIAAYAVGFAAYFPFRQIP